MCDLVCGRGGYLFGSSGSGFFERGRMVFSDRRGLGGTIPDIVLAMRRRGVLLLVC